MKIFQIFGKDLSLQIQMTIPSKVNELPLFAINVKFIENGYTQDGKITIHSKDIFTSKVEIFTATLITEDANRLCTGICYHDGPIEEVWLTIIEVENEKSVSSDKECTCPTSCDCQNPPPKGWDGIHGVYHISECCPVHNERPKPAEDCPVHSGVKK